MKTKLLLAVMTIVAAGALVYAHESAPRAVSAFKARCELVGTDLSNTWLECPADGAKLPAVAKEAQ